MYFIVKLFSSISDCWRITKGNLIDEFQNWGDEFNIEFSIKVTQLPSETWTNVFHFTADGNYDNYGDRIPALYINKDGYFQICSAVGNFQNYCTKINFVVGKQYQMTIIQWRNRNLKCWYEITINGTNKRVTSL